MLAANAQEKTMQQVKLFTRELCSWCLDAKDYLRQHAIPFEEIDVGLNPEACEEMKRLSGQRYVPTIVVDGHVLANFDVPLLEGFLAQLKASSERPPR
jgi:glutaredoxin